MDDIGPAIRKLLAYNELVFATRGDFTLIHHWIASGCDMEKDIIPAIEQLTQRIKNITSVAYFGPAVFRNRDNRQALEKACQALPQEIDIQTLRRYRAKGINLSKAQKAYLEQYESSNGKEST